MNTLPNPLRAIIPLFFLFLSCISDAQDTLNTELPGVPEKAIDQIFKDFDGTDLPGAAVAVVQKGKIVFKKGYGSANLEYDIPVSPSTVFHVASVSKQFTVFSVLLLAEEGKLSLDDDIRKHIPEVPDFGKTITLRHLATHTSGMRDQWDLLSLAGWRFDDVITKDHILKLVSKQQDLNFDPGEEYLYCNTGFTLLAEVVARLSGQSFAEFTQQRIFGPLKMGRSQFYDDHEKIVKNRAYSYNPTASGFQKSVLSFANVGATSLFTTVEDLALWAMNFKEPRVGNRAIVDQMNTLAELNDGETFTGAYGQFVTPYKGLLQIQHSGGDAGYRSYLGRFPDQEFAVMVFTNRGNSNPAALSLHVADLYLASDFTEEPSHADKRPLEKTIELDNEKLKAFESHYWYEAQMVPRRIYLKNDTLMYFRGPGNESALAPVAKTKFKMLGVPMYVSVEFLTENGKQQMLVVQENSPDITMQAYTPIDPALVDLHPYSGTFFSEELGTAYTINVKDGRLTASHDRHPDMVLSMAKADIFKNKFGTTVLFTRDANNRVVGMKVSTGRVRKLWFGKQ